MATTTLPSQVARGALLVTRLAAIWHLLVALGGVGLALALSQASWERDWLRLLAIGLGAAAAPLNLAAAWLIAQHNHRGRLIGLFVNYLVAVGCGLALLGALGVYNGLDVVAERFRGAVFWLVGVVVGYLVGAYGDRFPHDPATQRTLHRIGNGIVVGSIGLMLVMMGALPALLGLLAGLARPQALALLAGLAAFGAMFWALWRGPTARLFGATSRQAEMLAGYLFVAPNLLGFLLFFAGPLLLSLYLSLTNSDAFTAQFIGLANYIEIFSLDVATLQSANQRASEVLADRYVELVRVPLFGQNIIVGARDKLFWISMWNTVVYCFWTTLLSIVPALLVANVLNSKIPGMKFFRAIYFIPSIAGVVGVAVIWKWLYNSNVGFLNYGLSGVVGLINRVTGLGIDEPAISWLASPQTALASIIIMAAWQILGFNTILFLAGLQGIPGEIYEAATIDGASNWQQFRSMTLPLLAPTTLFVVTTTLIQTLQVFSEVVVMTPPPGGGPNNSTLTSVLYLYQKGFQGFQQGYAAAVAWVLFLFIFAVTLVQIRIQRRYGES